MQEITPFNELLPQLGAFQKVNAFESGRTCNSPAQNKSIRSQYEVVFENGSVFQSYDTIIGVKLNGGKLYLSKEHSHSVTTNKYCTMWCGIDKKERLAGLEDGSIYPME